METAELKTVTLKNGAIEVRPLVAVTMLALDRLVRENPIAFYELVMKARDRKHEFFGNTASDLRALSLVQENGDLHDSIRNIVLSSTEGEGSHMILTSAT